MHGRRVSDVSLQRMGGAQYVGDHDKSGIDTFVPDPVRIVCAPLLREIGTDSGSELHGFSFQIVLVSLLL